MSSSAQSVQSVPVGPQLAVGGEPSSSSPPAPKRRPGRPKGSGKKSLDLSLSTTPVPPKIKRPVGRPRKDGFPAGSVGPRRSNRKPKSSPDSLENSAGSAMMYAYPAVCHHVASAPSSHVIIPAKFVSICPMAGYLSFDVCPANGLLSE